MQGDLNEILDALTAHTQADAMSGKES